MKMKKFGLYTIFLILLVTNLVDSGLSGAQEDLSPIIDKLNSLEKDIRDVQRKINTTTINTDSNQNITNPTSAADHEIRILELENQLSANELMAIQYDELDEHMALCAEFEENPDYEHMSAVWAEALRGRG